jgi:hypothetical protein
MDASIANLLKEYNRTMPIYAVVEMVAEGPGIQDVLAVVHIQKETKMIRTPRGPDESSCDQTLVRGIAAVAGWMHILDKMATRRMDPRVIVSPTLLQAFTLPLKDRNMRVLNEMGDFHADVNIACNYWNSSAPPQFIDFDSAQV